MGLLVYTILMWILHSIADWVSSSKASLLVKHKGIRLAKAMNWRQHLPLPGTTKVVIYAVVSSKSMAPSNTSIEPDADQGEGDRA